MCSIMITPHVDDIMGRCSNEGVPSRDESDATTCYGIKKCPDWATGYNQSEEENCLEPPLFSQLSRNVDPERLSIVGDRSSCGNDALRPPSIEAKQTMV